MPESASVCLLSCSICPAWYRSAHLCPGVGLLQNPPSQSGLRLTASLLFAAVKKSRQKCWKSCTRVSVAYKSLISSTEISTSASTQPETKVSLFQVQLPTPTLARTSSRTDQSDTGPSGWCGASPTPGTARGSPSRNYPMFFKVWSAASECSES